MENENIELKAIYSRSQRSAEALAVNATVSVDIYFADPPTKEKNLASLLKREDITAVIICIPILIQLEIVKKCLLAGKHVQSEKPMAGDVESAREIIRWYRESQRSGIINRNLVWAVGEEFRLTPAWNFTRDAVASLGQVQTFFALGFSLIKEGSPFMRHPGARYRVIRVGFCLMEGYTGLRLSRTF